MWHHRYSTCPPLLSSSSPCVVAVDNRYLRGRSAEAPTPMCPLPSLTNSFRLSPPFLPVLPPSLPCQPSPPPLALHDGLAFSITVFFIASVIYRRSVRLGRPPHFPVPEPHPARGRWCVFHAGKRAYRKRCTVVFGVGYVAPRM